MSKFINHELEIFLMDLMNLLILIVRKNIPLIFSVFDRKSVNVSCIAKFLVNFYKQFDIDIDKLYNKLDRF